MAGLILYGWSCDPFTFTGQGREFKFEPAHIHSLRNPPLSADCIMLRPGFVSSGEEIIPNPRAELEWSGFAPSLASQ